MGERAIVAERSRRSLAGLLLLALSALPSAGQTPVPGMAVGAHPNIASLGLHNPGKILLVDDDESDNNNNPGDGRLSKSDAFYRQLLEQHSLAYDAFVVPRYSDGPTLEQLRPYRLILWYTGASYGGNRDNTSVVSLKDEETLRQYLTETGGSVIVFSTGYMNNALGAGGAVLWDKKESSFLQQVLGIQGGRGLLQRFKGGTVVAADGTEYVVTPSPAVEVQFSAVNPATAQVLFTAELDPDGKGARAVPVATSQTVGGGRFVYVGFTFENIAGDAGAAFGQLLQAAAGRGTTTAGQRALPLRATTQALTVAGTGQLQSGPPFTPRRATTQPLTVSGTGELTVLIPFPIRLRASTAIVTGTGKLDNPWPVLPHPIRTDAMSVTGTVSRYEEIGPK